MWKATSFFSSPQYNRARGEEMTVYVDEVFLLNAAVDYCLLRGAASVTGGGAGGLRLLSGAAVGGLWAAAAAPPLGFLARFPCGALGFGLLCLVSFGLRGRAWRHWLWFFGACCAFAGLVLAAASLGGIPVLSREGRVFYRIPGPVLIALAAGTDLLCRLCLRRFAVHRGPELVRLCLELADRQVRCTALRDNGNTLRDPVSGRAVMVADWHLARRLLGLPDLTRERFASPWALMEALHRRAPELRTRLIPYGAVGTDSGLLLAVRLDRARINGRPAATRLLAFSPTDLSGGGSYEAVV